MTRPRLSHKKKNAISLETPSFAPFPLTSPRNSLPLKNLRPLLLFSHSQKFAQHPHLPRVPGQVGFSGDPGPKAQHKQSTSQDSVDPSTNHVEDGFILPLSNQENMKVKPTSYGLKKTRQWNRWQTEVVPQLIQPYLALLASTDALASIPPVLLSSCACGRAAQRFPVTVLSFTSLQRLEMQLCLCLPSAPQQLISQALFPCAPIKPSLVVDLRLLDFASKLFLNISPNNTAWCKTMEDFLLGLGFKLSREDSLRRRFENALRWYTTLKHHSTRFIAQYIEDVRPRALARSEGCTVPSSTVPAPVVAQLSRPPPTPSHQTPLASTSSRQTPSTSSRQASLTSSGHTPSALSNQPPLSNSGQTQTDNQRSKRPREDAPPPVSNPFPEPQQRDRPSDYLRERCPLCFGGEFPPKDLSGPDAIVCVDACFTQKRKKGSRDPERVHPNSLFIPEPTVQRMQEFVSQLRPAPTNKPKSSKRARPEVEPEEEDGYEGSLKVPKSILNGCEASFKAADETREKASTQFFDDTALMALLCRHDRVLWIVNMRSAGEKQHYVLTLLEMLFQHLPLSFFIGILYDIGCQLHRSCIKWGFLARYLDRIAFGISVFHAFGHQWPCQVIYHPRKCIGFGLSDGEGCERFWHSISKLISVLRVSGYHQRLYTLDTQIHHLSASNLKRLGHWLARRSTNCQKRKAEAEKAINKCGHKEDVLQDEWDQQVAAQTAPLPRRSKNQGKAAVGEVIRLRTAVDTARARVRELEDNLLSVESDGYIHALSVIDLQSAKDAKKRLERQLQSKEDILGVKQSVELSQLVNDPFLALRMNAFALKTRLRDRLRSRKFELDPVERMVRKPANERKLASHAESSVQRRDPTVKQIARSYNKLCDDMKALISQKKAPSGSICPSKVPLEGLFSLDVDDDIWNDAGLTENRYTSPPLWLVDNGVQAGVKAMLERDRCLEEESRLQHERRAMQVWFSEEWKVLTYAQLHAENDTIRYHLQAHRNNLCSLYVTWVDAVQSMRVGGVQDLPSWGPSPADYANAKAAKTTASWGKGEDSESSESEADTDGEDDVDGVTTLLDVMSMVYLPHDTDLVGTADSICPDSSYF